ncbi:1-phosphatidylinositol 4,5-bisphosphate phosphodiesterase eta-2a isoform X4 [Takifugu rubripes]|uniref:Phosphoinositide phospholipase C n=1 Tax=Takifugu rubripes TaxID=31033 RepID=A0A674PBZ0_TAKRU|nr:1-phosphatidylinositol 4,5-bisphosphate phosphodiesterase eta-2 isoform X4 [Takifugu rubripes]XP_029684074.1 1-phosphatidylinositol 4,5-bisphosphate phosphodiesterase eta-2 isoform X4 [Takifugu rubripes]XP_029684075.1 1-phosphatidylinositol 4,5-bisphosphate phosphodiesterase eta-2 isoform X4 [Takifugu rubripes]
MTKGSSLINATGGRCRHFLSASVLNVVEKCMRSMQMGTQMVKLRGGSRGLVRFFYLDEHKSCIRWRPSRKNEKAKIAVDSIREIREGKQSEIFQRYSDGSFDPNCCFSLYYGEHMASLDLVTGTGEEARTWITGLRYLMAGISDEDSLAKRQRTRDQWLKQTFTEADKNGDGSLSISEVLQLLHKLNVNLPRQKVKQMFKEADTDQNQGTLGFEEFCSFYKMMSTRRDLYLLMLTYSNLKDHLDIDDLARFLNTEQKMTKVTRDHCLEIVTKFEPSSDNQKQGLLGIDGFTNYMRSPAADIFNPDHYSMNQDMNQPLCNYFIASSHNTYLTGDQLMSQSRVDMYAWVLQAGCRCIEVDCWDGPDGEPIVHHGYTLTSKILFRDVIETINKYAFIKTEYPVILSIENHCSVPQQKKMAQYLTEIFGDKLNLSSIKADTLGRLPSPEALKGRILVKGKKLPPNIDENAEEGDVSDEDSADEMEDDCKLMNGDTSAIRKQVENMAKKKLDSLLKESKIRDREDPDSFTITALPPAGKATQKNSFKGKVDDGSDTADDANASSNKRTSRSFMESFSKRKQKKTIKMKKTSSFEDTDTEQESSCSSSRAALHHKKKKTMKLSRALSDLVKYTQSVGLYDIEAQANCNWQVSSLSETKAHQLMQHKAASFIHFNQQQLSRIYPSSYRVDSSNFNPQPFWNAGCQLVALNYQTEGRVLQLNRAKFYSNGNCGYILKPACMCEGNFNPNLEDPLPARMKKQLVIKIISGQQLPKPKDSMLGDRGEIIDPFVEVEVIGLPVDCCKGQTRVVDDNGFNPMWEETLVFTIHMPDLALVRFLVWDHDPIGQDFIGQRTIAFNSMMPGYRHVYLEGMEEASVFVHIAVNDVTGKARTSSGIKGIFHKHPKQASLDSHAAAQHSHKHPFGAHLLRRTASAPTKGQPKTKKGFPEITNDNSSEGAGEEREPENKASHQTTALRQGDSLSQEKGHRDNPDTNGTFHPEGGKDGLAEQNPAPPIALNYEDMFNNQSSGTSEEHQDPHHSLSPLLYSSTTAINAESQSTPSTSEAVACSIKENGDSSPLSLTDQFEKTLHSQGTQTGRIPESFVEQTQIQMKAFQKTNDDRAVSTSPVPAATVTREELFSHLPSNTPVRRTKLQACVQEAGQVPPTVPAVWTDATISDRLWSKLKPTSQQDSTSSSSSISSSDTIIDLSLPNPTRKCFNSFSTVTNSCDPTWVTCCRSTLSARHSVAVNKSDSQPNLWQSQCHNDELTTCPVLPPQEISADSPIKQIQRRHTWSRLYMEELKQSSACRPLSATSPDSKSKSLGDLTSEDISCHFDSTYRSISSSFGSRPSREQHPQNSGRHQPASHLTEQLRKLASVEPLTPQDAAVECKEKELEEEAVNGSVVRRTSRSHSRVRYIANRAKKSQERQKIQGLLQGRSASFSFKTCAGSSSTSCPIEDRGTPEGACSGAPSTFTSEDLLAQLNLFARQPPRTSQFHADPDNTDVFFLLRL